MNRRSMIGKMLGGIAAVVGGGLLARALPREYVVTAIVDGRPRVKLTDEQRRMLNTDIGNFDHLRPQPPTNIRAFKDSSEYYDDLIIEWKARGRL